MAELRRFVEEVTSMWSRALKRCERYEADGGEDDLALAVDPACWCARRAGHGGPAAAVGRAVFQR
jgi:hypothetical protein